MKAQPRKPSQVMGQLAENLRIILQDGYEVLRTPLFLDAPDPGLEALPEPHWRVNRPELPAGGLQTRMSAVHEVLAGWVAEAIASGKGPVSIAGDCCTSIGVLAGLQRAGVGPRLTWFDAHGDFNTPETSPSGFLGGPEPGSGSGP